VKYNAYGGAFFLRQYKPIGNRFYFFVDESIGAGGSKTTTHFEGSPSSDDKGINLNLSVYPGVACNVTRHFQLETGLQNLFSVTYQHNKYAGGGNDHSFGASTAFSQLFNNLYLGARFMFGN